MNPQRALPAPALTAVRVLPIEIGWVDLSRRVTPTRADEFATKLGLTERGRRPARAFVCDVCGV